MRTGYVRALGSVMGLSAGAFLATGCTSLVNDCELQVSCESDKPLCIPSTNDQPVEEGCGVFVSSSLGMDTNAGTKSAPVQTLSHAVDVAKGKLIYACAEDFPERMTLATRTTIFGGLDCMKDWGYIGAIKKSRLIGDTDKVVLTVEQGASGTRLEDFTITGANALTMGASSIAMVVDGAAVSLTRCDLVARDAWVGVPGAPYPTAAQAGVSGISGSDACLANLTLGGDSVSSMCGMPDSISGLGGTGSTNSGGPGTPGSPGTTQNGGMGEVGSNCTLGTGGDWGTVGMPGAGAMGTGMIDKTGYSGAAGMPGTAGGPGQGGGGGGGAKGGTGANQCMAGMSGGASGGSGGSGGCGGAGGKPGTAGGSSIGLISLGAMLTLTSVTVSTGNGGAGGDGGPGQDGGNGGTQGVGGNAPAALKPGCSGGPGGKGGKGGQGGGGQGGHAIGIAYKGSMPTMKDVIFPKKGTLGVGGKGADAMHDGAAGVQMDMQSFP